MLMQEYECDSTLFSEQDVHGLIMIRVNISSNFFFGGGGGELHTQVSSIASKKRQ